MPRRVLIVEPHEETREAFMLLLEQWGLEAQECGAGPEIILKVARFRPDVAIIDISLPKLDGIAVAKALTAMESCPFLIALTGHVEAAVRQQALAAGFDRFELKPWNIDAVRAVLTAPETVRRRTVA